jgi:DNA phosphorothioation-dependent restriction protein DptH
MSPLHPLNVLYQIQLLEEQDIGNVRDNLIEKLTPLYLLPFIKDTEKNLYHAIEQKKMPEWRYYAPITNKRYQGARNFVQKLVCDKITQYKEHFSFLFDDLGNKQMSINLVNMGDCREIFQGLLRFYEQSLKDNVVLLSVGYFRDDSFDLIFTSKPELISSVRLLILQVEHLILEYGMCEGALDIFDAFLIKISSVILVIDNKMNMRMV